MIRTRRAALAQSAQRFSIATNAERVCAEIMLLKIEPSGRQHGLGVLDLGGRGKILADEAAPFGKILRAAEIDGVVFQRLPLHHQPVALRLLDRLVQLKAVKALGATEGGLGLGDSRLKILFAAR